MGSSNNDLLKTAALGGLAATGLGAAGIGPMAGMFGAGAGAAGAGAAGLGAAEAAGMSGALGSGITAGGGLGLTANPALLSESIMAGGLANAPAVPGLSAGASQIANLGGVGSGISGSASALDPSFATSRFMAGLTDKMASPEMGLNAARLMTGQQQRPQSAMVMPSPMPMGGVNQGPSASFSSMAPTGPSLMQPTNMSSRFRGLMG